MQLPMTIFLDIDGCIIEHTGEVEKQPYVNELIPGTLDKLKEWDKKGYRIILTTGRRESTRKQTEIQLQNLGVFYDQLIMGIGGGTRVIINDKKLFKNDDTCLSFSIERNEGIKNIKI